LQSDATIGRVGPSHASSILAPASSHLSSVTSSCPINILQRRLVHQRCSATRTC
jgi:hypothetical protein